MDAYRHGKKCRIKFSSIKCTLSASSQEVTVIVVYGGKNPMTLVTNCTVSSKEDMMALTPSISEQAQKHRFVRT
jgi:hypothetical protein